MPNNDALAKASGMFNGLKSRLGFAKEEEHGGSYDSYGSYGDYDDPGEYNSEYSAFDDDGYNARDDREYAGYGSDYDENVPVGGFRPATIASYSGRSSRFGRPGSTPNLVSISDVKAHTQVPDDLLRDPLANDYGAARSASSSYASTQASPYSVSSIPSASSRSEGLNSLFEPTDNSATSRANAYDPYEAYSSTTPSTYTSSRGLSVINPVTYGDAEQVSRALKAGDMVVLVMRATPDDLSKRILDFAFGAASALDANVECPAEKVFAIARGGALTEREKLDLRTRGVF